MAKPGIEPGPLSPHDSEVTGVECTGRRCFGPQRKSWSRRPWPDLCGPTGFRLMPSLAEVAETYAPGAIQLSKPTSPGGRLEASVPEEESVAGFRLPPRATPHVVGGARFELAKYPKPIAPGTFRTDPRTRTSPLRQGFSLEPHAALSPRSQERLQTSDRHEWRLRKSKARGFPLRGLRWIRTSTHSLQENCSTKRA